MEKILFYDKFGNLSEKKLNEDIQINDFIEKNFRLFLQGESKVTCFPIVVYQRKQDVSNHLPEFLLETGDYFCEYYSFESCVHVHKFLQEMDFRVISK